MKITEAEEIYEKAFYNYISPSVYEKMDKNGWGFVPFPFGGGTKAITLEMIKKYLDSNMKVKCGYMCTSIRGYHDFYIISKTN